MLGKNVFIVTKRDCVKVTRYLRSYVIKSGRKFPLICDEGGMTVSEAMSQESDKERLQL
jgi:hypothetical protein